MSTYGHQQKFKNFEKFGAILGQNGNPGLLTVNGSVLNSKVLVINGRPTRAVTFKLTPALLALRVSKLEGKKHSVTYMGSKVLSWPKASSGGLEPINQFGGLFKAHPVEIDSSLKGTLVKPVLLIERYDGQLSWVQRENSSAMEAPRSLVTMVLLMSVAALVIMAAPALVSATEGSRSKFSGVEVSNRRLRAENQTPLAGVLKDGSTAKLMGPGYVVPSDLRHQGDGQNSFSPLLGLGSEEGLCFGERDDSMMVSGEKGEKWSHLDGVEMLQVEPEHPLLQWKHSEVNPSGLFHGEDENGSLECSPLSKWDPNDHKELEVI